jgi:predicted nucleotide-binding protein
MHQQSVTGVEPPTVFFSYARVDAPTVQLFAQALRSAGVQVLLDVEFLKPGERFEPAILAKLRSADALVFFVSPASLQSAWTRAELQAFGEASDKVIFPVLINGEGYDNLPSDLAQYQALLIENDSAIPAAANRLAEALASFISRPRELTPEAERRASDLAAGIADGIRRPVVDPAQAANSIFLVHGHDHGFRDEVQQYLQTRGIRSVILSQVAGGSQSLLLKFLTHAGQATFAIVLMSPDDVGASRRQYENAERGGTQTLRYRARENVILELGFFYGSLGWENVFVIQKPAEHTWPDFERPSDLGGADFFDTEGETDWRDELTRKLRQANFLASPEN